MTHSRMLLKLFAVVMFGLAPLSASADPPIIPPATYPRPHYGEILEKTDESSRLPSRPALTYPVPRVKPAYTPPVPPPKATREEAPSTVYRINVYNERGPWYIGFGFGGGNGTYTENGATGKLRSWDNKPNRDFPIRYFTFKVGATLTPKLLMGLNVSALRAHSDTACYSTALVISNYNLVTTWFPWREGFFLRSGGGLSLVTHKDQYPGTKTQNHFGGNILTGVGYAFWLGRSFNLTVGADYSAQRYSGGAGKPNASQIVAGSVGFDWY